MPPIDRASIKSHHETSHRPEPVRSVTWLVSVAHQWTIPLTARGDGKETNHEHFVSFANLFIFHPCTVNEHLARDGQYVFVGPQEV